MPYCPFARYVDRLVTSPVEFEKTCFQSGDYRLVETFPLLFQQSLKAYGFWWAHFEDTVSLSCQDRNRRILKWIPHLCGRQRGAVFYRLNNQSIWWKLVFLLRQNPVFLEMEKAFVFHLWTVVFGTPTFRITGRTDRQSLVQKSIQL